MDNVPVTYTARKEADLDRRLLLLEREQGFQKKKVDRLETTIERVVVEQLDYDHKLALFSKDVLQSLSDNNSAILAEVQKIKDQEISEKLLVANKRIQNYEESSKWKNRTIVGFSISVTLLVVAALIRYFFI